MRNAMALVVALLGATACGGTNGAVSNVDSQTDAGSGPDAPTMLPDAGLPSPDASAAEASAVDASPPDAGKADATDLPDAPGPFSEAPHTLPVVTANGGPVLANPMLVTITYADDTNRAFEEALGAFMPTSKWLEETGKQYGVGAGTSATVELSQNSPTTIDDSAIQSFIASLITNGTAPDPVGDAGTADDGGVMSPGVYMIYFPPTTNVTIDGSTLCQISAGGYHYESSVTANGHSFAYAVVSPCPGGLPVAAPQNITWAASHEFIEASTDPFPVSDPGYVILDSSQPWADIGGEVGDLCTFAFPQWAEGSYTALQRVYSNAAAKAGKDPCAPATGTGYGADVEPQTFVPLAAGATATFQVKGWSTAPLPAWQLSQGAETIQGTATPTVTLGANTLDNGQTTTLTVTMPAGTASDTIVDIVVYSSEGNVDYTSAVVGVYVP